MDVTQKIKDIQKQVQEIGNGKDIPTVFSCLQNTDDSGEDMIMHLAIFGDMTDCCFFMAAIMQKIIETHIPKDLLDEMGKAAARKYVLAQVDATYQLIQKHKKFEMHKDFHAGETNPDDVPFVTTLQPRTKGDDDGPNE